jgi:predicted CoA-substrate-specific enzyme activase
MKIGLDVGSTTLKCVVLDGDNRVRFRSYERHGAEIAEKAAHLMDTVAAAFPDEADWRIGISGSAGMGLAEAAGIQFVQEVYATRHSAARLIPRTDAAIELGGEDAKILFLTNGMELRMNGSCAGGTGAFIDQMATLLGLTLPEMNALAAQCSRRYVIASRCGVFAKSDIQPLLNQGATKADLSVSIFDAVVNQTVAGLAQGRKIEGNIVYLGGPLTFLPELRASFDRILGVKGICPEDSLYYAAIGAASLSEGEPARLWELSEKIGRFHSGGTYKGLRPLFRDEREYEEFQARHPRAGDASASVGPSGEVYLGIDAGSTTVKAAALNESGEIVFSRYRKSGGNPVGLVAEFLADFYREHPGCVVRSSAVTGYGEDLIKNAFQVDHGIVETIAHYIAARAFRPDVDFIIDIGGQDIKCFKIRNGAIDTIFLNEACSSGCGSFLQSFAEALGYSVEGFAQAGLFAERPADLGSRCTVFMNSSVKQAQKDGASVASISAGLSISVVKNALYKVLRASSADELGQNIVVQGGTFLNDAVLRAFELEAGRAVTRPPVAGLMGAYGAALYAKSHKKDASGILDATGLKNLTHQVRTTSCGGCENHCSLTINSFGGGRSFIGGNRCEKPVTGDKGDSERLNLYRFKRELLEGYKPVPGPSGRIGIPMGLNLYELLPFWHTFFTDLGFEVVTSPLSDRALYLSGQHTIPSDTVCYPAKLMHGHIEALLSKNVDAIFYPCMTYNLNEGLGSNHYNCPVVAYYPEVIRANVPGLAGVRFVCDYAGLHRPKDFAKKMAGIVRSLNGGISARQVSRAAERAYEAQRRYMERIREKGRETLELATEKGLPVIVLAGRPYHLDPEVNHGIDALIAGLGAAVVSEDALSFPAGRYPTDVLNQWTYHSRLYAAAEYIAAAGKADVNLVQLVSFGCGLDAITTDEERRILERAGRIYTQIKIDEITNLGAVKIRMRSLFAALEQKKEGSA